LYPDGTKVREYKDGTLKKVNPDGTCETIPKQARNLELDFCE